MRADFYGVLYVGGGRYIYKIMQYNAFALHSPSTTPYQFWQDDYISKCIQDSRARFDLEQLCYGCVLTVRKYGFGVFSILRNQVSFETLACPHSCDIYIIKLNMEVLTHGIKTQGAYQDNYVWIIPTNRI